MDGTEFDHLMKRLATTRLARLTALRGLAAGSVAALIGMRLTADEADAHHRQRKRTICLLLELQRGQLPHPHQSQKEGPQAPATASLRLQRALQGLQRLRPCGSVPEQQPVQRRAGLQQRPVRGLHRGCAVHGRAGLCQRALSAGGEVPEQQPVHRWPGLRRRPVRRLYQLHPVSWPDVPRRSLLWRGAVRQ